MMNRRDLFPPIEPHRTGMLRLDSRHALYWELSGNPRGVPVLFLHGGPGAGATPVHRRFFDPDYWRIVIFDQRGAGRSTPLGEVTDNSPAHLVADIERLRTALGIDAVYATAFPQVENNVRSAVLALHGGELPVGEAQIVATGETEPPWLISAPTMRLPGERLPVDTVHPYLAARGYAC